MRSSFTLLEVIFAIVVISIVLLGIPGLFIQSANQTQEALKIEAVTQGYRSLGTALTYPWDEKSRDENVSRSYILDTAAGSSDLNRTTSNSQYRQGNFNKKATRVFWPTVTYATTSLGKESGESENDDIDDFLGNTESIVKHPNGMLLDMNTTFHIRYINDSASYSTTSLTWTIDSNPSASAQSTNIKWIEINVSLTDLNYNTGSEYVVLRAFSCNIGEPKIASRSVQ